MTYLLWRLRWWVKQALCNHVSGQEWDDGDPFWLCQKCGASLPDPDAES